MTTREKGLSRPPELLRPSADLSFLILLGALEVRRNPLCTSPQDALLTPLPLKSGSKPKKHETPRACPLLEFPLFDARTRACSSPALQGIVWSHGAAPGQECRLRLKRFPPRAPLRFPPFKSSTVRPAADALAPSPFCAVLKRKLEFPFWKEKLRLGLTFSLLTESSDSWREQEQKATAQSKRRQPLHKTNTFHMEHRKTKQTSHIIMNINRIIITGNLVAAPTLRETNAGTPVASATIANNEFFNGAVLI
jgi:hypothetical protein